MSFEILLAGFGGQGILFSGKVLAYAGLLEDKEVSWLPSYGPEMRGGTANCHVIIADKEIGSPIIVNPGVLIAMNLPSLDKFEAAVKKGGTVIIDSSLINREVARQDVKQILIPATQIAQDMGASKLANMVIVGRLYKELGVTSMETLKKALEKSVPPSKKELLELNWKAIETGYNSSN